MQLKKQTILFLLPQLWLYSLIASDLDIEIGSREDAIFIDFLKGDQDIIATEYNRWFPIRCEEVVNNAPWVTGDSLYASAQYFGTQVLMYGAVACVISHTMDINLANTLVIAPFLVNKLRLASIIAKEQMRTGTEMSTAEIGKRVYTYMIPWKVWAPIGAIASATYNMLPLNAFSENPAFPLAGHACQLLLEGKHISDKHIAASSRESLIANGTIIFKFKRSREDDPISVKLYTIKHEQCIMLQIAQDDEPKPIKFKDTFNQRICPVCREDFCDDKKIVAGLCSHLFCLDCFNQMTTQSENVLGSQAFEQKPFSCPSCRFGSRFVFVFDEKDICRLNDND